MRKLTQLWQSLERAPGLRTILEDWRQFCGPEYPIIRPLLRPTEKLATQYPCPNPHPNKRCPRRIKDYGDGRIVAKCKNKWIKCGKIPLTISEALLHELDVTGLAKLFAPALGVRCRSPEQRSYGVWTLGLSTRRSSRNAPVFLIIHNRSDFFREEAHELLLQISGPIVIAAPTMQFRDAALQAILQNRGAESWSLEEYVGMGDNGQMVSLDLLETSADVTPTPVAERPKAVEAFSTKHRCRVKDIWGPLGLDQADFYKWRRGALPDTSQKSMDIERILREGPPE